MHTKQKIERLLGSAGLAPNKRLGQNFLIDLNLMRMLLDAAQIRQTDVVLEVGTGTGSLTEELAERAGRVVAVEFDSSLAAIATDQLKRKPNTTIINADILENKSTLCTEAVEQLQKAREELSGRMLLVANLPYNVSTPVMMNLLHEPVAVDAMYVTVQKEVGERMTAGPGSGDYGTLSVMLAATGDMKILHKLGPNVFWPKPAVDSVMVRFLRKPKKVDQVHDYEILRDVVALLLGHRRKMARACVKFAEGKLAEIHDWALIFEEAFIDPHIRPEELTPLQFISLANICSARLG